MMLLKDLYAIHSPSRCEWDMVDAIQSWVKRNVPTADVAIDEIGNIYITKGMSDTYPCVVAHTDQVQSMHSADFVAVSGYETTDVIFGWSPSDKCQQGLGADDKNGIWICLRALESADFLKVALFVSEEIGCVGSERCDMDFFNNVRWVIQADRRGAHDLITNISGTDLCSDEFLNDLHADRFGYVETSGLLTDVYTLKTHGLGVSCINISCGYYEPHTDNEITIFSELENALDLVLWAIDNLIDVYPHKSRYSAYDYYDDYDFGYNRSEWEIEDEIWWMLANNPETPLKEVSRYIRETNPNVSKSKIKKMFNKIKKEFNDEEK